MRYISLTRGQVAIVDDADFARLNQWNWMAKWNARGHSFYAARTDRRVHGQQYTLLMHRVILGLEFGDKSHSDHINHDTLDNRRDNLRAVTSQQNHFNRKHVKGYHKCGKKYNARICVAGKQTHLGAYATPEEAHLAYSDAKKIYHKIPDRVEIS